MDCCGDVQDTELQDLAVASNTERSVDDVEETADGDDKAGTAESSDELVSNLSVTVNTSSTNSPSEAGRALDKLAESDTNKVLHFIFCIV